MVKIELGDLVKDELSKFKGIVNAIHIYLHGCVRMTVVTTDKEPKSMTFDLPQLILVKKKQAKKGNVKIGGTNKFIDEGR